jgi:hypothetical protein
MAISANLFSYTHLREAHMRHSMAIFKKKVTQASLLMATLLGAQTAQANDPKFIYQLSVEGKAKVPEWLVINNIYSLWSNVGVNHSCGLWTPPEGTIIWGEEFEQSRICNQNQERDVTPALMNPILDTTKQGDVYQDGQLINVTQYNPSIGTLDYVTGERAADWGTWIDAGGNYACDDWTPSTETVNLFENFTQNRDCSQNQTRSRQVFNVWASGEETPKRVDPGAQTITEEQLQVVQGTRDFIDGQSINAWSTGANDDPPYACEDWGPTPTEQAADYMQDRVCSQNQSRTRTINDVWKSGRSTFNSIETDNGTVDVAQLRTVTVSWSDWSDRGRTFDCTEYDPLHGFQTENFTQEKTCVQRKTRTRSYSSGESFNETGYDDRVRVRVFRVYQGDWVNTTVSDVGSWLPAPSTQTAGFTQTRSYRQNRERIWDYDTEYYQRTETGYTDESEERTVTVGYSDSAWENAGSQQFCGGWEPATNTQAEDFTQTQSCEQSQVRDRIYSVGSTVIGTGSNASSQTVNVTNSRTVTVSWSDWTDYQGVSNCSAWSPATNTRQQGVSFTQTRLCDQGRVRTRSYSSDQSASEYVTIRVSQTQDVFGTDIGVTGQSAGAWRNTGGIYSCSSYGPAASTVNLGESYTATRTCSQNQYRDVVGTISYADGSSSQSTTRETQVARPTSTTSMAGTRNYVLRTETVFSHYSYGADYNCGAWGLAPSSVNDGEIYTQTRSCSRDRTAYNDVYTVYASGYRPMTSSNVFAEAVKQPVNRTRIASGTKQTLTWTYTGNQMQWAGDGMAAFYAYKSAQGEGRTSLPSGSCPTSGSDNWYIVSYAQEEANRTCVARGASGCVTRQYVCQ